MQLHRELEKDGLVVLTLDVDLEEWKTKDKVLAFLREQKSTGPNYILRDDEDTARRWLVRHDALSTPAVVVYDRDGFAVPVPEFTGKMTEQWDAEEKWVRELVQRK